MEQKWKFEVFAETDGILAVLPFGEIKIEIRKNPKAVSIVSIINIFGRFIESCSLLPIVHMIQLIII